MGIYLAILATALLYLLTGLFARKNTAKKKALLKSRWGKPKDEGVYPLMTGAYAAIDQKPCFHRLTGQTMQDLDFQALFALLDHTTSRPGEQYFFNLLQKPIDDPEKLLTRDRMADYFLREAAMREWVQLELHRLSSSDAYYIAGLLDEKPLPRPPWMIWYLADSLGVFLMLLLSPFYPVLLIWLMLPFALNLFLHFRNKQAIFPFLRSFPMLDQLIRVASKIREKQIPGAPDSGELRQSLAALRGFQKKFSLLRFGQSGGDDLGQVAWFFIEIIKAFFLLDVHTFHRLVSDLEQKKGDIDRLFCFIGFFDTSLSIASLRAGGKPFCKPRFTAADKKMEAVDQFHPLIENCQSNSIRIQDRSILITGSNMSGKTTFIRAMAVNSLLAQTIYTCFAQSFLTPFLKVFSSIRIDDSMEEGKSYYFEEVNVMANLIGQIGNGCQHLFILDEVFKGTNAIERLAAGMAILKYLNQDNHIVLVATHDLELSALLQNQYDLYHFSETIQDSELLFDHRLKPGPLTTRNAIRILEICHFPPEITRQARELSQELLPVFANRTGP